MSSFCLSKFRSKWASFALAVVVVLLPAATYAAEKDSKKGSDEDAIRQCVETYVAAYNRHDAKAVAALWSETGNWVSPTGEHFQGRDAIAKELEGLFEASDGLRIEVGNPTIRLVTPDVAMEEGTVRIFSASAPPSNSSYVAIHVKQEGEWRLDSVRETELPDSPAAASELQELAWLVGEWDDTDTASHASVTWTKNKTFLNYSFKASTSEIDDLEGTQVIGWDPLAGTIRSWMFDSDGGFGEGTWSRKGDSWVVKFSQTLADGRTASATNIYTLIDGNHFAWKSVGRQVDGEYLPNLEEIVISRAGASEAKSASDNPDQKPAKSAENPKKKAAKKSE